VKPYSRCCNGCDAPPHAPSKVLCRDCFAKLDAKMQALFVRHADKQDADTIDEVKP
jgi:hypothetical protein